MVHVVPWLISNCSQPTGSSSLSLANQLKVAVVVCGWRLVFLLVGPVVKLLQTCPLLAIVFLHCSLDDFVVLFRITWLLASVSRQLSLGFRRARSVPSRLLPDLLLEPLASLELFKLA